MSPLRRRPRTPPGPLTAEQLLARLDLPYRLARVQRASVEVPALIDVLLDPGRWPSWFPGASTAELLDHDAQGFRLRVQGRRVGIRADAIQRVDTSNGPLLTALVYESLLVGGKPVDFGERHVLWFELRDHADYVDVEAGFASRPGGARRAIELRATSPLIVRDLQGSLSGLLAEAGRRGA